MYTISISDRIIAGLSYLSFGMIGAIYFLIMMIAKKGTSTFLKYHICQSVCIYLLLFAISLVLGFVLQILDVIPFVKVFVRQLFYLFNMPVFMNYSVIQLCVYILWGYLAITSFWGLYSYVPWISNAISELVGRK